jgi:hypothetical protein
MLQLTNSLITSIYIPINRIYSKLFLNYLFMMPILHTHMGSLNQTHLSFFLNIQSAKDIPETCLKFI